LVRAEIDKKNILSLLKGRNSNLDREVVGKHLISGGHIRNDELLDIFGAKNMTEFLAMIEGRFAVTSMMTAFMKTHNLVDFEVALDKTLTTTYMKKLKNVALSVGTIFHFIISSEHEWDNIKRIAFGKRYELPAERISSMLLLE
jgi:V/A-type H+-transporting ATPase subunit C